MKTEELFPGEVSPEKESIHFKQNWLQLDFLKHCTYSLQYFVIS